MRTNEMNQKIKYFILEFAIDEDSKKTSTMCVLGYRQPTFEEAEEFWKEDCSRYGDEKLNAIYEIDSSQVFDDFHGFDMDDMATFPVFGTDRKTIVDILSDFATEAFKAFEAEMLGKTQKEIFDKAGEIYAKNEIHGYLCDCANEDLEGYEIKVLADLGTSVIEKLFQYYLDTNGASVTYYSDITEWVEDFCEEAMKNEV